MAKREKSQTISSKGMHALEANAEYFGISLLQLMENAGRSVAEEVATRFEPMKKVAIFCGLGGNGGDGFVVARHLISMGHKVTVILAGNGREICHEAAKKNFSALTNLRETTILEVNDSSAIPEVEADIIIDALLGTGTKGELKPPIRQLVEYVNSLNGFKIAVDVPTGIDSDTGESLGVAVKSDTTVTFHASKTGLTNARKFVGELVVKDIGLPKQLENYAGPGDVFLVAKKRKVTAHKGDSGRLLTIGGSDVFSGAPTLVSLAALRTGVDIVYLAAPAMTAQAISAISPDLITVKLDGKHLKPSNLDALVPLIKAVDAIVLGPGLGLHPDTKDFVKDCIDAVESNGKPLVLDADGLKAFAEFKRPFKMPVVLTPHAAEYGILTGHKLPKNVDERVTMVQKTAGEFNSVILLKGQNDLICDKNRFKLNFTGNPGMTVGGTGDVLSGVVGSLLAQKAGAFEAAVAGAFINGAAGDFVASEIGYHMVATDLLKWIPIVFDDPMSHLKVRRQVGASA